MGVKLFPGGSCNPTTWRADTIIPALERAGWTYYNPQVDEWSEDLVAIEREAKQNAEIQLFVIDAQTRAIASLVEATSAVHTRPNGVWLVVMDIPDGMVIEGQTVTGRELKDLNRGRAYLRDLASEYAVPLFATVEKVAAVIDGQPGQ